MSPVISVGKPAAAFVPHRPPMLWIDELSEWSETSVVCQTTIKPDFIFLENGRARGIVMIELVAQAAAVYLGYRAHRAGRPPRFGMIVGCREAELFASHLDVGDALRIAAEQIFDEPEVSAFTGTVSRAGQVVGRVSLSVIDGDPTGRGLVP